MKILKLVLKSSKTKDLREFYGQLMGLNIVEHSGGLAIQLGSSELVFEQVAASDPFYHYAITIPANQIEQAQCWLADRGISLMPIPGTENEIAEFTSWNARSVYFYDPAGNIVELIARFDLHNEATEPFDSSQFLALSEVGLVIKAARFDEYTKGLMARFELPWFAKQHPLEDFRVIGDEEGLFIAVTEGRNWFPTKQAAGDFPLTVTFEGSRGTVELLEAGR
jgi:catechol-2,3-dioxygenase